MNNNLKHRERVQFVLFMFAFFSTLLCGMYLQNHNEDPFYSLTNNLSNILKSISTLLLLGVLLIHGIKIKHIILIIIVCVLILLFLFLIIININYIYMITK
jgi:hypothetical protein